MYNNTITRRRMTFRTRLRCITGFLFVGGFHVIILSTPIAGPQRGARLQPAGGGVTRAVDYGPVFSFFSFVLSCKIGIKRGCRKGGSQFGWVPSKRLFDLSCSVLALLGRVILDPNFIQHDHIEIYCQSAFENLGRTCKARAAIGKRDVVGGRGERERGGGRSRVGWNSSFEGKKSSKA